MPRTFTVSFSEVAVTAAVDVFELTPGDDKPIEIIGLFLGQSTEFGDAAAEVIPYQVIRGHTTSGSGGASTTPRPTSSSTGTAGFAAETNNTTAASTGTTHVLHADTFNVAVGEKLWLPEDAAWGATQADTTIVVRLASAPADSLDLSGCIYVKEYGGS